jgi:hypothetical protein
MPVAESAATPTGAAADRQKLRLPDVQRPVPVGADDDRRRSGAERAAETGEIVIDQLPSAVTWMVAHRRQAATRRRTDPDPRPLPLLSLTSRTNVTKNY